MNAPLDRLLAGLLIALTAGAAACDRQESITAASESGPVTITSADRPDRTVYPIESDFSTDWTIEQAQSIMLTSSNTAPVIDFDDVAIIDPDLYVWDTWPLRTQRGGVANVDGWKVIFSLTAEKDVLPGERHGVATIRYFYSRDGKSWGNGEIALSRDEAAGLRQWAGSAFIDDSGELHLFYTATGAGFLQELALAKGKRFRSTGDGLELVGSWSFNGVIARADGELYQTQEQSEGILYSFRDPWYYFDRASGEHYILFEGNTPLSSLDEIPCSGSAIGGGDYTSGGSGGVVSQAQFNGSVGIARATNAELTEWELLPPLLEAICVNQQLERPHLVVQGNRYYLFFISHKFTFAPPLDGPDGLYGFVGPGLRSDYQALNGHGLVVANPPEAPFQAYSWLMLPNTFVQSFANYSGLDGIGLDEVGTLPPEQQKELFGGSLAPSLKVVLSRDRTRITAELKDGFIPGSGTY